MNPISRLIYLWKRREDKEMKMALMFYVCLCIIILTDFAFGYFFYFESKIMFIVNIVCMLINFFIYHLFELNKRSLGVNILLCELLVFLIFATIIMGWDYGFQQYIYGMLCIFFLPFYTQSEYKHKEVHVAGVGFVFISTYYILDYVCNIAKLPPSHDAMIFAPSFIHALNSFVSIAAVSSFCIISSMINNEVNKTLKRKADFDELTSLYNRYGLNELLSERKSENKSFYIAITDIDFFKKINDTYGHNAGDEVLKKLSSKLVELNKHSIVVGRWGGEEFLIIGDSSLGHQEFKMVLENFRSNIEKKAFNVNGKKINVTVSIGIAKFNNKSSIEDNIKEADINLYKAKEIGRNKIVG